MHQDANKGGPRFVKAFGSTRAAMASCCRETAISRCRETAISRNLMAATAHVGHDAPLGNPAKTSGCKRREFDELDGQHKLSCSVQIEKTGQESKNRGSMKRSKTTSFANQKVHRTFRSGAHTTRCVHAGIQMSLTDNCAARALWNALAFANRH